MNHKLLASAIYASLFLAGTAFAQPADAPVKAQDQTSSSQSDQEQDTEKKPQPRQLEAMTVTGSLLARPEYQTTSPIQIVNVDTSVAAGQFSTADFVQNTSVAAGSTQINNQFGGFVVEGGTGVQTIDLRGLGSNRTLVLLDGQRPGPSGTRGQVGAFDLNVIPAAILNRVELVKDGSSSIYGSDAVAGVVNLITKKRLDRTNVVFSASVPEHGGGEQRLASIGTGWNFDSGNISVAAQVDRQEALKKGDRDFLRCNEDMFWDSNGNRIDREDRSILKGTSLAGCNNLYANSMVYYWDPNKRFVPSPDGSTQGPFPGYKLRPYPTKTHANSPYAYYEDQLNFPFMGDTYMIDQTQRSSLYASTAFTFGGVAWSSQWLYTNRNSKHFQYRQFFPVVDAPQAAEWAGGNRPLFQVIMPFPMPFEADVDYFYGANKLSGAFSDTSSWGWEANVNYSRSNGDYSGLGISEAKSGDLTNPNNKLGTPLVNYFDPGILNGSKMQELINAVGQPYAGNTVYTQTTANALINGDLFSLPAGPVSAALGAEYRRITIDDQPPAGTWGLSSAAQTKGTDKVSEVFGEVGIPILEGVPMFESLNVDLSARQFKYSSVGDSDHVWKYGLNWQLTPSWRIRGTIGTSYRAPGLYELYLGDQSAFLAQTAIDPCINWGESNNDFIKKNCAAAGIPSDYAAGGSSSATIYQGGGKGFLTPEKSRAKSLGVIWAPTFASLNVALDYFDYNISGEIGELGAGNILAGCYGSPVYPNNFCNMFKRNPANAPAQPNMITEVRATYVNINSQRNRGYDLQLDYTRDFGFGQFRADGQFTYMLRDTVRLFDTAEESGQSRDDLLGYIGRPKLVGIMNARLKRGNFSYNWQGFFTGSTRNKDINETVTYQGHQGAIRDIRADKQLRHNVSVGYEAGNIGLTVGVRNLLDKKPDQVSSGVATVYGNTPVIASQYDWFGRTYFARLSVTF